jgi:hypothetical protein
MWDTNFGPWMHIVKGIEILGPIAVINRHAVCYTIIQDRTKRNLEAA